MNNSSHPWLLATSIVVSHATSIVVVLDCVVNLLCSFVVLCPSRLHPSTFSSVVIRRLCSVRRQLLPSPSLLNGASIGKKQRQSNSRLGLRSMDHGYRVLRNRVKEHHQKRTQRRLHCLSTRLAIRGD
ncbi:hypothetical protein PIB30_010922 [Stylosanthes scabra]|uniref:Secreted protein n=1 Tax=Stylosanthes scabra TaxID=79078 RepID=A0ABU6T641_9FABA|nr:hypothetical protein [Stylosanthes scabra]